MSQNIAESSGASRVIQGHVTAAALEPVRVSLAFRLGEVTLFERELVGLADRRHFTRKAVEPGPPDPPTDGSSVSFYFYPSYPVAEMPPTFYRRRGWICYTPYAFKNHYIDLQRVGSFERYLAGFSSKSRSTLRRKVRKFADSSNGTINWRIMTRPEEMRDFLSLALPLSARTYQDRLLGAGLPASTEFADRLQQAAARGEVLAYLLFLQGQPVAYVLCFCADGIASYDFVGFDPDMHALSPGTVLQYLLLESMFTDGRVAIFDFTEGEGAQKEFFATDYRYCAKTYLLRADMRALALVRSHQSLDWLSGRVGGLLQRLNLKTRVRKLLRSRA